MKKYYPSPMLPRKTRHRSEDAVPAWGWALIIAVLCTILLAVIILTGFHHDLARAGGMLASLIYPLAMLVMLALAYFIPAFIARGTPRIAAIAAANLLLGWTIIGWIIVLIWALAENGSRDKK